MDLCRRETLTLVLSVLALEGLHGQHNEHVFLRRMRAAFCLRSFLDANSLSLSESVSVADPLEVTETA